MQLCLHGLVVVKGNFWQLSFIWVDEIQYKARAYVQRFDYKHKGMDLKVEM